MKGKIIISILLLLFISCQNSKFVNEGKPTSVKEIGFSEKGTEMQTVIINIIKAYQNKDEKALNKLIPKKFGITFLYRMGAQDHIANVKKISFAKPVPSYLPFDPNIITDYKITQEKLPIFSCETESWNKPAGIYIDLNQKESLFSEIAKFENANFDENPWSDSEVKKLEIIERNSHKVIVIGQNQKEFIFYIGYFDNIWYLTAIDRFEVCSA
ncbi:hypothetical protein J5295_08735 [Riemerella anatipestifer]|uniref:Lipoprotein n=1 Tax=Riemerella anatipestifer (strain ATCC 11845 / DSM 15868 / JCM 9532 / NCTC 11014) TaxID=693978 RepID=E4TE04_RIEAD|nr:hypothetical protein [Riemerella anatipestifer]ADQ83013.1 hypothetical protein Riean_1860 [Riemerella anatipestifer ATCC 11845 = DSM 15868]ADZ11473.1 hypothetical protein RIA_0292 [Riemerella anatipestifer RA-GD]AFD55081.1 hypothetical protein RA0C_0059 [Riemerella anatipestifer ATCC 11845 = DSM 15868]AGC40999.1 hypothetical protein G148_1695 [Riemerella anatipestifer RA-CH-2]AKP70178.1 hypothetical protein CG08_2103 [Riemerella anatipestifer]